MMNRYDQKACIAYAKKEGVGIGLKRAARNMLAKGYSVAEVIGVTNLSREQVRTLSRA